MARRGTRKPKAPVGDPSDPEGFWALLHGFLEALRVRNFSEHTVRLREAALVRFVRWAHERELTRPAQITRPILERYQRHLFYARKRNGDPLSFQSQHAQLTSLRAFFKWLVREERLLHNPASELQLPRVEKRLPRHVLTTGEVEAVLALPDLTTPLGIRDRTLMETLYSTGIRRMEAATLGVYDVDPTRSTMIVRQGKGKKDRVVPIGERALAWVRKYLQEVRPLLLVRHREPALFLTSLGEAFKPETLTALVRAYVDRAALGKKGACHLFRHTMATLMMEGGADLRFVQEILGHASPETTQIYTQVSITKLKEIHAATHPGARLQGAGPGDPEAALDPGDKGGELARAGVLAELEEEGEEDDADPLEGRSSEGGPDRC